MHQYTKCILIISQPDAAAHDHTLQILSKARKLANQAGKAIQVLCTGQVREGDFQQLFDYGADEIICCAIQNKNHIYQQSRIVSDTIQEVQPEVVLFPATEAEKAVAAIVSVRLDAGLTADCIDIEVDDKGEFYFSRTAMNDSVVAKIKCINCGIKMCTVKENVFLKEKLGENLQGHIHYMQCKPYPEFGLKARCLSKQLQEPKQDIDIHKYSMVFCIGRGVDSGETRDKIYRLADRYHAGVVGTRAAVDENLIEQSRQVGQSGKIISPQTYVAFGVSGASQHIVGIKNAETIIAINHDARAPIFDYADYPIVETIESIITEMEKR